MSIASVSGRNRAQRKSSAKDREESTKTKRTWPELSEEERRRHCQIDDMVMRFRGGHKQGKDQ